MDMDQQPMTRRQKRLLKKQERERVQMQAGRKRVHVWHVVALLIVVGLIGASVYGIQRLAATTPAQTYTAGPVHWHAAFELEVCGEKRDLPGPQDGQMVGNPLYHHHGDNTWHIEGRIISQDDIKLGRFLDKHDVPFDRDRLFEKINGDACKEGGPAGQVKMFVNGEPNNEFRDYIGQYTPDARDTVIRIVFE